MAPIELRPAQLNDLDPIRALVNRAQRHDGTPRALTAEELQGDLDVPYIDLGHDTRVALVDGDLAGWAWVWHPPTGGRQDRAMLFGEVDPAHRAEGVGRALLGWSLARAIERLRGRDHDLPRFVRVEAEDSILANHRLYRRLGFTPVRWFDDLIRPVTDTANFPRVTIPGGVDLVPWPDDRDGETLAVRNEAFGDHWGSAPIDADTWHAVVRGHGARADLSVVAVSQATGSIVGVCLNHAYPEQEALTGRREAWIVNLATTRAERGRGLATAMIAWSLAVFEADGSTHAMISVDSDNPTGAARLYRNLGFEPVRRSTIYQIEVGP